MSYFTSKKCIFLLPIISGIFLATAFLANAFWWIILFSLVPLLLFLKTSFSKKSALAGGLLAGLIFFGVLFSYFFWAYPLDWAGINSAWGWLMVFLIWILCVATFALFFGFFGLLYKWLVNRVSWREILIIPSWWVLLEYLRSWSLGAVFFGPGGLLGPHWSIGHLGYALSGSQEFLQLAGWGGVYLLGFFVVLINYLIFWTLASFYQENKNKRQVLIFRAVILLVVVVMVWLAGYWKLANNDISQASQKTIKVALLQTDEPSVFEKSPKEDQQRLQIHLELLERIKNEDSGVQLIVANERANLLKLLNEYSKKDLKEIFKDSPVVIADLQLTGAGEDRGSALFYFLAQNNQIIGEQKKLMLMPYGEYLPYNIRLAAQLLGKEQWLNEFLYLRGRQNQGNLNVTDLGFGRVGGLLCSEILSPVLYRTLTGLGADFLINMASDSAFRGSPVLLTQNLAMAKVRATESNRYFAQATNAGFSYVIDNNGLVRSASLQKGNDVIFGDIKIIPEKSFYVKAGDWILVLAAIIIFLFSLFLFLKKPVI